METIEKRRSIRNIKNTISISNELLLEGLQSILKHTPSSYNAQSQRMMLLLNEKHQAFWELVTEELRKIVPKEKFKRTENKLNGFKDGYGTVLFFDNAKITNGLIEKFPLYKQNFETWANEQNGMLQINVWNYLTEHQIGASLQHYNEIIEGKAKEMFSIPEDWKLTAQMPFGDMNETVNQKQFVAMDERFILKD